MRTRTTATWAAGLTAVLSLGIGLHVRGRSPDETTTAAIPAEHPLVQEPKSDPLPKPNPQPETAPRPFPPVPSRTLPEPPSEAVQEPAAAPAPPPTLVTPSEQSPSAAASGDAPVSAVSPR